jgi:hypothetical protein
MAVGTAREIDGIDAVRRFCVDRLTMAPKFGRRAVELLGHRLGPALAAAPDGEKPAMNSRDRETLVVALGVAVLAISLLLPLGQKFAAEHDVGEVAVRAVEVKDKLLSAAEGGKPLRVRVSDIVDGLSPDAALAEAEMLREAALEIEAMAVAARPEDAEESREPGTVNRERPKPGAGNAVEKPEKVDELAAAAPATTDGERAAPAVAPRDGAGEAHQTKRAGAASIWEQ